MPNSIESIQYDLHYIEHVGARKRLTAAIDELASLRTQVEALRAALRAHRADLHQGSSRPCATCRLSAKVLGLDVPDRCPKIYSEEYPTKEEIARALALPVEASHE